MDSKKFADSMQGEDAPLLQRMENRSTTDEVTIDVTSPCAETAASSSPSHSRPKQQQIHSSLCCSAEPSSEPGTCRICFEQETAESQDPANPLICPCQCSGSSKYVHRQCLQQWRETNHRADAYYQCEVCKYRYRYQRLWWGDVLGSQITLTVLFVLIMATLIGLLGFVPITHALFGGSSSGDASGGSSPSSPSPSPSPSSSSSSSSVPYPVIHILNGVVMMGIVGLVMSLLLLFGRACGVPVLMVPDPWFPCICCLDGGGVNSAPLLAECIGGAGGECCVAMAAVVAVVMLVVGVMMAAWMLYGVLFMLVQAALNNAQHMVENVQQDVQKGKESKV